MMLQRCCEKWVKIIAGFMSLNLLSYYYYYAVTKPVGSKGSKQKTLKKTHLLFASVNKYL